MDELEWYDYEEADEQAETTNYGVYLSDYQEANYIRRIG